MSNPGPAASHFGLLYLTGQDFDFQSDIEVAGELQTGYSTTHYVAAMLPRVITSHGADVRDLEFSNVRWVLLDGYSVSTMNQVAFYDMATNVDQFTVNRTGDELSSFWSYNLNSWSFGTVPDAGFNYVKAIDSNGGPVLRVDMANPSPSTHGGHASATGGVASDRRAKQFHHAISVGTRAYVEQNKALDEHHAPASVP